MGRFRLSRFWSVTLTLVAIYAVVRWGIPAASRQITTLPFPLPVPGTLVFMYMVLALVALFMFVTFSDTYANEFMRPVWRFMRGDYGKLPRLAV